MGIWKNLLLFSFLWSFPILITSMRLTNPIFLNSTLLQSESSNSGSSILQKSIPFSRIMKRNRNSNSSDSQFSLHSLTKPCFTPKFESSISILRRNQPNCLCILPIDSVPAQFKLDRSFYQKYVSFHGIPIVGTSKVKSEALFEAARLSQLVLQFRGDIHEQLMKRGSYIVVMAFPSETLTQLPEFRGWDPKWDKRARGMGGHFAVTSEENLLCDPKDDWKGTSVFIHELAHVIHLAGLSQLDPPFSDKVRNAYHSATSQGKWERTYAGSNPHEYWAEGVTTWFNANLYRSLPDGTHGPISTRESLRVYDSTLADLIGSVLSWDGLMYSCPLN